MANAARGVAIACASGGFKGVFVHGVLSAFEEAGVRVDAYAASSASVASTAFAVAGLAGKVGVEYWLRAARVLERSGATMSDVVLQCVRDYAPLVREALFEPGMPRLIIAASAVTSPEAAEQTQGPGASTLGRRLLVAAGRSDRRWADANLALHLYDSQPGREPVFHGTTRPLTPGNFDEVGYASARMLHGWPVPATIEGQPYIDASYTCLCPAREAAAAGHTRVIAIACEPGPLYRDVFRSAEIGEDSEVTLIRPTVDPRDQGVDYVGASEAGLIAVYEAGFERGRAFLSSLNPSTSGE
jgi:hypothetical protein